MKTAECVSPKHPDKMCDQISDAILDLCLSKDPMARVAVETMGGHGKVIVMGEVTLDGEISEIEQYQIVRSIAGEVEFETRIVQQSPEIANGVDTGGAGDQGIMKGYATNETPEFMPKEYSLARSLCKFIYDKFPFDGKTQVTIDDYGAILAIVASFQNAPSADLLVVIQQWIYERKNPIHHDVKIYANPAGDWNQGGFDADTGLTGRKLMVDNYGPRYSIGGGAFSGKDATKVDRSAAYMARMIAVDVLKDMDADEVEVDLAYAIGVAEPVAVTAKAMKKGEVIMVNLAGKYDLTPKGIISTLDLRKPQFERTAQWGHFGNGFTWK